MYKVCYFQGLSGPSLFNGSPAASARLSPTAPGGSHAVPTSVCPEFATTDVYPHAAGAGIYVPYAGKTPK